MYMIFIKTINNNCGRTYFSEINPKDKFSNKFIIIMQVLREEAIHYAIGFSLELRYYLSQNLFYMDPFRYNFSDYAIEKILNISNEFKTSQEAEDNVIKLLKTFNYKVITKDLIPYI